MKSEKQHVRAANRATRLESSRAKRMGEREASSLSASRVQPEVWPTETKRVREFGGGYRKVDEPIKLLCNRCSGKHVGYTSCPSAPRRRKRRPGRH